MENKTYNCLFFLYIASLLTFYMWIYENIFTFIEMNNYEQHSIRGQTFDYDGQPYGLNYSCD